jgi:MFS superfamily sulfate permease-like transporter
MSKSMDLNFFKSNLLSGISVAALSMPIGIAYAEMVGLPPEAGVYTVIFGLIGYFVLGTSRELIIGPDSAIVALLASSVIALSGDGSEMNLHFIALITITTGVLFFVAGKLKLGFIANFLSKPILIGFLNGIAGILIISQLQKFTGVKVEDSNSIFGLVEFFSNLTMLHFPTLITGISAIIIIKILEKSSSKIPAQFTLIVFSIIGTVIFNLEQLGVLLSPEITSPVPTLTIPDISLISGNFSEIFFCSLAILFISYTNQILTARSFSGNKNEVDPNREFYAVGLSDVLCGLFNGYPVCGSGSRTAVNIRSGSNSKLSGILAAGFMLFVILFFSKQFSFIPSAVIGAIIIDAGIGIFNFKEMNVIRKFSKEEYYISLICMAGVLINGVLYGILLSILLSF